jgi:large subunit ribosomal protein L30
MLKITLTKSTISETPKNRRTVNALGLRKTNRSVLQEDNPVIRGMIHHVKHLLKVEEVDDQPKARKRAGSTTATSSPKAKAAPEKAEAATEAAAPAKKAPAKKATTTKKDS